MNVRHHIYEIRKCLASVLRVQGEYTSEHASETGKEGVHPDAWRVCTLPKYSEITPNTQNNIA